MECGIVNTEYEHWNVSSVTCYLEYGMTGMVIGMENMQWVIWDLECAIWNILWMIYFFLYARVSSHHSATIAICGLAGHWTGRRQSRE